MIIAMSKLALFDINPDELFEKSSISEINQVQKKFQNEIERKREELRTMVGERYRDLIQAADTIAEMKITSACVLKRVGRISSACEKSQNYGFHNLPKRNDKNNKSHDHYTKNSIVIQIHLLISIPEKIWTCIDNDDYLGATQLYLLALHISTGLQIRISESTQLDKVSSWRELIQRQWNIIMSFKTNIKTACHNTLKSAELSSESAARCLCSLCLLDDLQLSKILMSFISLRLEFLQQILHPHDENYNVKTKVTDSANLLINTLILVHDCFVGSTKPYIIREFENIVGDNASCSIEILQRENAAIQKVLPEDILNFKPSIDINHISSEALREAMGHWLSKVESCINEELSELINLVSSVKSLQGIRLKVLNIERPSSWKSICEDLFIPEMIDIFSKYYQPLLTKRIQWLVQKTWTDALLVIKKDLKLMIKDANNQPNNLSWKDCLHTMESDKKENLFNLVNVYGFNTDLINICNKLDQCMKLLLEELYIYLYDDNYEVAHGNENICNDSRDILNYLQQYSMQSVRELLEFIKSDCLNSQSSIMLSRFLTALLSLCPNLYKCFLEENSDNCKDSMRSEIKSLNLDCWRKWLENMDILVHESINKLMPKEFSSRTLLTVLSQRDVIKIQEKDDQGQNIESTIKIPSHSSFPLQNILNLINNRIILVQPHTLPSEIRQQLIGNVVSVILDYYENSCKNEDISANQVSVLQFYFDVKYLQLLMLQRDNKSSMEKFQQVADKIKSMIDPFDFDVFYPHLQNNIKKAVQKTQMQLGCMVSNPEHLSTILGTPHATQDIPCIIPLVNSQNDQSTNTYWFTLLPITAPTSGNLTRSGHNTAEKIQFKKTSTASPKRKMDSPRSTKEPITTGNTGLVRSGAAAFFGAMGQDWFGSH